MVIVFKTKHSNSPSFSIVAFKFYKSRLMGTILYIYVCSLWLTIKCLSLAFSKVIEFFLTCNHMALLSLFYKKKSIYNPSNNSSIHLGDSYMDILSCLSLSWKCPHGAQSTLKLKLIQIVSGNIIYFFYQYSHIYFLPTKPPYLHPYTD